MKIRLLNDGGYAGLEGVTFPVEVEGELSKHNTGFNVSRAELARIGVTALLPLYFSSLYDECEVVE